MVQGNHFEGDKKMEKKQTVSECFQDIRDILPTLLILVIGLVIMILVIPYAFRLVISIIGLVFNIIKPYMQKTCDVAEKAILAKKKLRKKCVNRDKM